MEPISGLAALYAILRRKVDAGASERAPKAQREQAQRSTERSTRRASIEELEQQIRSKLKGVARDGLSSAASKRWVIASLLSWELDSRMQNEPKFNSLVRRVQQSVDSDARLKAKFERVMEQLSK